VDAIGAEIAYGYAGTGEVVRGQFFILCFFDQRGGFLRDLRDVFFVCIWDDGGEKSIGKGDSEGDVDAIGKLDGFSFKPAGHKGVSEEGFCESEDNKIVVCDFGVSGLIQFGSPVDQVGHVSPNVEIEAGYLSFRLEHFAGGYLLFGRYWYDLSELDLFWPNRGCRGQLFVGQGSGSGRFFLDVGRLLYFGSWRRLFRIDETLRHVLFFATQYQDSPADLKGAAEWGEDVFDEAFFRRLNGHSGLVRLDFEECLAFFYLVAYADLIVEDDGFGHCPAEFWEFDFFGHGQNPFLLTVRFAINFTAGLENIARGRLEYKQKRREGSGSVTLDLSGRSWYVQTFGVV